MIRLALLLFAFLSSRHWLWNTGTLSNGDRLVWEGTLHRFGCGPHVALKGKAEDGLLGYVVWQDWQDEGDLFEAWT